ncbi:hypothetical protein [Bacteroides sp. UBA939]|uniref:hypothetical protein n=1 Tax=Bacteroides sp. UBA939 TaxID=1946092 RepID=UPI0025BBE507|nr:hypothetical protein [Bacteroides sp. UBA939]
MKRPLSILFLLSIWLPSIAQLPEYGLHVQSYPLPNNKFTSMALENGELIETNGEKITLNFNLWVRKDNVFGTVFRIITDKHKNIDLMYSVSGNDKRFPIIVTGDTVTAFPKEARLDTWIPVSLTLDPKGGNITALYDSVQIDLNYPELAGTQGLRIAFGYCPFEGYSLLDVASVNLKDISISRGTKEIRLWKMARHNEDVCYDEISHAPAAGTNTQWIIDQYITWKKIYSQNFATSPSIAFDAVTSTFYMARDNRKLYVFQPDARTVDSIQVKGGEFMANYPNQLIYIPQRRQLLSYNLNENLFSAFDPATQSWKGTQTPVMEHDYWNNTIVYNPADSSLISFGGYGHYHYNNKLLVSYPYEEGKAQYHVNLTDIHPRYSSASVVVDSVLYIFGGRGCPSGRQELSPRNYYDLYAVNLSTLQARKLWEASDLSDDIDFQPCENMVYDAEEDCFYLFGTQQGGTLMKIDRAEPGLEFMSLPLSLNLDYQYLYCNLYHSPGEKKLYLALHQADVRGKAHLEVYELNYPPISVSSFKQPDFTAEEKSSGRAIWIILGVLIGLAVTYFGIRARLKSKAIKAQQEAEAAAVADAGAAGTASSGTTSVAEDAKRMPVINAEIKTEIAIKTETAGFHNYDFSKGCVCFFGGFHVVDKAGNDITGGFTPNLKALLILLILYTGKDPKGIIGHRLIQLLWYDKTEESAKNNRNVYMSKLRNLLEKVGDIRILNRNGFWSIQFMEGTICDYLEALHLYKNNDSQDLEKLLELLLRGMMLPNMEIDWIDAFKNDFSNGTIDLLCRLLKREDLSDTLRLKIADTLFQHDYINEEALCVKCRILCRQGKKGLAKTVYDAFCKEYAASMGTEYKYSLMQVIEEVASD